MKLYDIPGIDGYKSGLAGWALILTGIGGLIVQIGRFLSGEGDLQTLMEAFYAVAGGLGILGVAHKQVKLQEAAKEIKKETTETGKTADRVESDVLDIKDTVVTPME